MKNRGRHNYKKRLFQYKEIIKLIRESYIITFYSCDGCVGATYSSTLENKEDKELKKIIERWADQNITYLKFNNILDDCVKLIKIKQVLKWMD